MKSTRNNKKRILSFVLSFVMMCTVFAGIAPLKASALDFEMLDVSNIKLYDSGCLKEITIKFKAAKLPISSTNPDGTYNDAFGRIAIHTALVDHSQWHYREPVIKTPEWPSKDTNGNIPAIKDKINTFMGFAKGDDEFFWTDLRVCEDTFEFEDGKINLLVNGKYYVYLWTRALEYGVYPDALMATLEVGDGKLNFNGELLKEVPKTINITFDRTKYTTSEYVELLTYNSEGTLFNNNKTSDNATVAMPEDGYVKVVADNEFTVTAAGKTYTSTKDVADGKYHCVISDITTNTTVAVTRLCDITFDKTNYLDSNTELFVYVGNECTTSTNNNGSVCVMPTGGSVKVSADEKFTVTAAGKPYTSTKDETDGKYHCVISDITTDTTVAVNKVALIKDITDTVTIKRFAANKYEVNGLEDAGDGYCWGYFLYQLNGQSMVEAIDTLLNNYNGHTVDEYIHNEAKIWESQESTEINGTFAGLEIENYHYVEIVKLDANAYVQEVAVLPLPERGEVTKDVDIADDAPIKKAELNSQIDDLMGSESKIFSTTDKDNIQNGAGAEVWIEINKLENIDAEDKDKIETEAEKIMGENPNVTYFEVDLFKQVGTNPKESISEPGVDISITITIPDELINNDSAVKREYKLIRLHEESDGTVSVDVINGDFNAETKEFTFKTNKFSTYAIAYKDTVVTSPSTPPTTPPSSTPTPAPVVPTPTAKPEVAPVENPKDDVPNTGHSNVALYAFAVMAISGGSVVFLTKKKKSL